MPRKVKELPRPCPICGRNDGTIQFVIFNHRYGTSNKLICRIGHYYSDYYNSRKVALNSKFRQINKPYGKRWHNFLTSWRVYQKHNGKEVDVTEYFDIIEPDKWRRSITFTPHNIHEAIRDEGWKMVPERSLYMRRRKPKF
jgi:hypothetical protein